MARYRKETLKEKIARLEREVATLTEEREALWNVCFSVATERSGVPKEFVAAAVMRYARCSCGRHASMFDGKNWKICETCMST